MFFAKFFQSTCRSRRVSAAVYSRARSFGPPRQDKSSLGHFLQPGPKKMGPRDSDECRSNTRSGPLSASAIDREKKPAQISTAATRRDQSNLSEKYTSARAGSKNVRQMTGGAGGVELDRRGWQRRTATAAAGPDHQQVSSVPLSGAVHTRFHNLTCSWCVRCPRKRSSRRGGGSYTGRSELLDS